MRSQAGPGIQAIFLPLLYSYRLLLQERPFSCDGASLLPAADPPDPDGSSMMCKSLMATRAARSSEFTRSGVRSSEFIRYSS